MQDHYWGIGRYVFHLARGLAHIAPQNHFRVLYNPHAKNTRFNFAELVHTNLELCPAPANAFSLAEQRLAFQTKLLSGAALWHSPFYALPYALSLPLVVTLEDVTPLVLPQEMPNAAKRLVYQMLNQLAARRARQVITLSNAARDDLVKYLHISREKITVIPLATFDAFQPAAARAIERVRTALDLPARYVLYLGINKPHKNLLRLVQAWKKIQADAVLLIAGHWDTRFPEVKDFVARENLGERVLFRHDVAEANLAPLVSGAITFVFPSLHEGFGLPPLEAMACGTPVVCANASSLPEVVGEAAVLFDPLDVSDIERALERVLADANVRMELRDKGLKQARQFSWERTARETLQVYQEVIQDH